MNSIGNWLRRFSARFSAGLQTFMAGRYGTDRLNMVILCAGLFFSLLATWIRSPVWNLLLVTFSYGLMIFAIWRSLSRNTYRRYQENRMFWQTVNRLRDWRNCYYSCPKCRQTVRVPRGKGKISITCPRCGEKFIKKT